MERWRKERVGLLGSTADVLTSERHPIFLLHTLSKGFLVLGFNPHVSAKNKHKPVGTWGKNIQNGNVPSYTHM